MTHASFRRGIMGPDSWSPLSSMLLSISKMVSAVFCLCFLCFVSSASYLVQLCWAGCSNWLSCCSYEISMVSPNFGKAVKVLEWVFLGMRPSPTSTHTFPPKKVVLNGFWRPPMAFRYPYPTDLVFHVEDYKHDNGAGPRGQLAVHPAIAQFILDNAPWELLWTPWKLTCQNKTRLSFWGCSKSWDDICSNRFSTRIGWRFSPIVSFCRRWPLVLRKQER